MSVYVLFEVEILNGKQDDYLACAANLKESLAKAPGFIRSERFSSLAIEGKLLSLSVWEDEAAITQWRNLEMHRQCQEAGRADIFKNYTITVLSPVARMYDMDHRDEAPSDSNARFNI